ncbi:MAG: hypothetical protein H6Q13_1264 [Bacteroidetes bacterium]|nr:hypothetical protein [Bacteroidota bacterium]
MTEYEKDNTDNDNALASIECRSPESDSGKNS